VANCAYCGKSGKLTKEHIFPNWMLRVTDYQVAYSEKAGRRIGRNQTINDVCAACNNGPLGALDGHVKALYQSYMVEWVREGQGIAFEYDYGLLLRWLLKVSYNSSRASGVDCLALGRYRDVLCTSFASSPIFMIGFVGTIKPTDIQDIKTQERRTLFPQGVRIGRLQAPMDRDRRYSLRAIQINSFRFTLAISEQGAAPVAELEALRPALYGRPLVPEGKTFIPSPMIDTVRAMQGVESWPG